MGLVSQDPVLFATSILENIRLGRDDVTVEGVLEAAKTANAHDFIMALPEVSVAAWAGSPLNHFTHVHNMIIVPFE